MAGYGAEIMPAGHAEAVTPSNTVSFDREMEGLYVGVGGNIGLVLPSGTAITFLGVPTGSILPVRCIRVNVTNTTATDMVALATRAK